MELFKKEKKQPIKLRGFNFIGYHKDYGNCCYYVKELERDNFELMEMMLEGTRKKPEIGAGTKVQIIDAFMSNYLRLQLDDEFPIENKTFIQTVVDRSYFDLEEKQRKGIVEQFTSKVPQQIQRTKIYKDYIDKGYKLLYCSNTEGKDRLMGIVNIVLVKEDHIFSKDERIDIDRKFSLFKPLKFMVTPGYILDKTKVKYHEEELPLIVVNHDLLK
jgi:hypothetical protein